MDSKAGEGKILAGVSMCHIAMVCSSSHVLIKGLVKLDRPHIIQQLDDDDPEEVDTKITRTIKELMMEKKVKGSKVWIVIGQLTDGC